MKYRYEIEIDTNDKDYKCRECGGEVPLPSMFDVAIYNDMENMRFRGKVKCETCESNLVVRMDIKNSYSIKGE